MCFSNAVRHVREPHIQFPIMSLRQCLTINFYIKTQGQLISYFSKQLNLLLKLVTASTIHQVIGNA